MDLNKESHGTKLGKSEDRWGKSSLTAREKIVLRLVAEARSNKEIAESLDISPSTVKRHLENILKKLHLKNRVAAAVYAVRMSDCPAAAPLIRNAKR